MRFLLPAVMLRWGDGILGALTAALRPIKSSMGGALQCERTGGDPARVAFRRDVACGEGTLQDGQQVMNPVVGLGLTPVEWQAMQSLQRIGLLKNADEKQFVFPLWQGACRPTTDSTVARLALQGRVRWIQRRIGGRKRREQTCKLCVR